MEICSQEVTSFILTSRLGYLLSVSRYTFSCLTSRAFPSSLDFLLDPLFPSSPILQSFILAMLIFSLWIFYMRNVICTHNIDFYINVKWSHSWTPDSIFTTPLEKFTSIFTLNPTYYLLDYFSWLISSASVTISQGSIWWRIFFQTHSLAVDMSQKIH